MDNQNAGVHQYTRSLVDALVNKKDRKFDYILIRQKKEENIPFEQIILKNIKLPIGYASFRLFFLIPYLIRKHKIDIVLEPAHFGPFNLPKNIKRVTMIHDLTPIKFPHYHKWHSQFLQHRFLPRILKKANLILTNSEHTRKDVLEYIKNLNPSKVKTILLGKDEFFKPDLNHESVELKEDYFLSVGTIEPRKNIDSLLDAFGEIKKITKSKVKLYIVGGMGWNMAGFKNKISLHPFKNDIKYFSFVEKSKLRELYTHALCLVYPSFYEGFGFPILEAMSCGTNVITSDVSSMPEVGGELAYYINPYKVDTLIHQMKRILNKEIGHKKDELIAHSNTFSWENYANEFEDALLRG